MVKTLVGEPFQPFDWMLVTFWNSYVPNRFKRRPAFFCWEGSACSDTDASSLKSEPEEEISINLAGGSHDESNENIAWSEESDDYGMFGSNAVGSDDDDDLDDLSDDLFASGSQSE